MEVGCKALVRGGLRLKACSSTRLWGDLWRGGGLHSRRLLLGAINRRGTGSACGDLIGDGARRTSNWGLWRHEVSIYADWKNGNGFKMRACVG